MPLTAMWRPNDGEPFDHAAYNADMANLKSMVDPLLAIIDGDQGIEFETGKGVGYASIHECGRFEAFDVDDSSPAYSWTIIPARSNTVFTKVELPADCPAIGSKNISITITAIFPVNCAIKNPLSAGYAAASGIIYRANRNLLTHTSQGMHPFKPPASYTAGWIPAVGIPYTRFFRCVNIMDAFQYRIGTTGVPTDMHMTFTLQKRGLW